MNDLTNLQELINDKADARLERDLKAMGSLIKNNPLLAAKNEVDFPKLAYHNGIEWKPMEPYWIFHGDSTYMNHLRAYWKPIYRSEEARLFMNQVATLSDQVKQLLSPEENDY